MPLLPPELHELLPHCGGHKARDGVYGVVVVVHAEPNDNPWRALLGMHVVFALAVGVRRAPELFCARRCTPSRSGGLVCSTSSHLLGLCVLTFPVAERSATRALVVASSALGFHTGGGEAVHATSLGLALVPVGQPVCWNTNVLPFTASRLKREEVEARTFPGEASVGRERRWNTHAQLNERRLTLLRSQEASKNAHEG